MTTRLIAQNSIGFHGLNSNRLLPQLTEKKRILSYLFQQGNIGASTQKIASNLRIDYRHTAKLLRQLEIVGECFTKGKNWCSTAAALAFDPKPTVERLKAELERDLFGDVGPPERVKVFLEEYHAARTLRLSEQESWRLAQRKILEARA